MLGIRVWWDWAIIWIRGRTDFHSGLANIGHRWVAWRGRESGPAWAERWSRTRAARILTRLGSPVRIKTKSARAEGISPETINPSLVYFGIIKTTTLPISQLRVVTLFLNLSDLILSLFAKYSPSPPNERDSRKIPYVPSEKCGYSPAHPPITHTYKL